MMLTACLVAQYSGAAMFPAIPAMEACISRQSSSSSSQLQSQSQSLPRDTYDNTNTSLLPPPQALPNCQPRQLDRMIHIDPRLPIPPLLLAILRILPEITKLRLEDSRANGIRVGHVAKVLLARVEELVEVFPVGHVAGDEDDVFGGGSGGGDQGGEGGG